MPDDQRRQEDQQVGGDLRLGQTPTTEPISTSAMIAYLTLTPSRAPKATTPTSSKASSRRRRKNGAAAASARIAPVLRASRGAPGTCARPAASVGAPGRGEADRRPAPPAAEQRSLDPLHLGRLQGGLRGKVDAGADQGDGEHRHDVAGLAGQTGGQETRDRPRRRGHQGRACDGPQERRSIGSPPRGNPLRRWRKQVGRPAQLPAPKLNPRPVSRAGPCSWSTRARPAAQTAVWMSMPRSG